MSLQFQRVYRRIFERYSDGQDYRIRGKPRVWLSRHIRSGSRMDSRQFSFLARPGFTDSLCYPSDSTQLGLWYVDSALWQRILSVIPYIHKTGKHILRTAGRTYREKQELEENKIFVYHTLETAKPTVEYAAWMSKQSLHPDIRMDKWIDSMIVSYPIDCSIHDIPEISQVKYKPRKKQADAIKSAPLTIRNGWVTRGSQIMTRGTYPHKSEPGTTGWQGIGSLTLFIREEPDTDIRKNRTALSGNWRNREAMCCTTAPDYGTNAGETIMNGTCRLTRRSGLLSTNIHTVAVEQEKHKTD